MHVEDAPAFPFTAPDPLEPPAEYAKLRRDQPVAQVTLPSGDPAWLVTRYSDVRKVLSDQRFSREAITAPDAPRVLPIARGSKSIFVMDPPEHSRLRRLVSKAFSARRIEALRPRVQEITDGLIGGMAAEAPPADLVAGLAQPLPITVICEMLGVPYEDVGEFRAWTDLMLSFDRGRQDEIVEAKKSLAVYLTRLIAAKRAEPTEDLLTVLIQAQEAGDRLTDEELLAFGYTLLGAGYHATTSELAHGVLRLLRHPEQLERLRADAELLPGAVEELLRCSHAGSGIGALRIAMADVDIGGVTIRAGDAVLPGMNAANLDEDVFERAEDFDVAREPNPHLSFGHGIHHCLGAQLGRMELEVAIPSLWRRFPALELAVAEEELRWSAGAAFSRPDVLPVRW